MLNICSLIQKFFGVVKSIKKRLYRTGVIILSGTSVVAILLLNSNGFDGSGKNKGIRTDKLSTIEGFTDEDDTDEIALDETGKDYFITGFIDTPKASIEVNKNHQLLGAVEKITDEIKKAEASLTNKQLEKEATKENQTTKVQQPETKVQTEVQTQFESKTQSESETQPESETQLETQTQVAQENDEELVSVNSSIDFFISQSDYYWLLRIVQAEAGDQDDEGIIMVANVIFNRVRSTSFPNSVEEVIFQNNGRVYQFEPVKTGRIYDVEPSDKVVECVQRALNGEDFSKGALFFTMKMPDNSWFNRKLTLLFIHGDHYFYTY